MNQLQSIVSTKWHREHRADSKRGEKLKSSDAGVNKICQTNQANLEESSKIALQPSNSDKMAVPLTLDETSQSRMAVIPLTVSTHPQRNISNPKPEKRSEAAKTTQLASRSSSRHQEFDSIETSLAKITCSQRAICSSLDSLV